MTAHFLSQLAHVEILTPKPDESLRFFTQILGLEESGRNGQSVYLRGWGEHFHHSLQLTEGDAPGQGHIAWRSGGEEELERAEELERVRDLEAGLEAFEERRWERCRMVVENSLRLGQIEINDGDKQEHATIMRDSMIALAAPI